ncbi:MAG: ABC transporter ATP-binding protein [Anaerolineae bacterium]|nr:ABC transporter ATP-binding protein [Anaerolineae bacterium]
MPLLEGKGVTRYFGGLAAVSDVDFCVEPGEIVGLIGPNGAGKTTLFNLISGALASKAGVIRFKDQQINGLTPNRICRLGVARTFQSVQVFGGLPVLDNIRLGALFGISDRFPTSDAARQATESLEFVGLSTLRDKPAKDLTLVNQKRVEVARALATRPEMLLLDELMAGLNPTEVAQSMELVTRIQHEGVTILMIEHVMKAIMSICDRIIVLHHGKKLAEGTPQEIATSKTVVEVYLGE